MTAGTAPLVDGLSVVLPAYNEEENVGRVISRGLEVLPGMASEWEIIVVDDGSRDRTSEIVEGFVAAHYPNVRLLRHPVNQGYGAAIRSGFRKGRHELIFYTDADNQFDIAELRYALPMMEDVDVLCGFRVYRYDTPMRLALSWVYNLLVRVLFRVPVRDVDCAFKIFRREVIDKITIETDNFFVDTELMAKARKWNFRIAEKGVRHYPRTAGETTVRPGDIPRTLKVVFQMWQRIHRPTREQIDAAEARGPAADATDVERLPAHIGVSAVDE